VQVVDLDENFLGRCINARRAFDAKRAGLVAAYPMMARTNKTIPTTIAMTVYMALFDRASGGLLATPIRLSIRRFPVLDCKPPTFLVEPHSGECGCGRDAAAWPARIQAAT
jgi:hypothetical protein